jgi:hypothetical protein
MKFRYLPGLDHEKWYFYALNRGDKDTDPIWRYGAAYLHGPNTDAHAEWSLFGKHRFGFGFEFGRNGSESDIGLDIHAGLIGNLYLRLRAPWTSFARVKDTDPERYTPRHTGINLFPGYGAWIRFKIEDLEGQWTKGQPWWRSWNFGLSDVMGPTDVERTPVSEDLVWIPLPEGSYLATSREETLAWRHRRAFGTWRDRILGAQTRTDVVLTIEGGIPIEGKGEDAWNCGMDGLFMCAAATVEEAIANAIAHVRNDRKRYGGPHDLTEPTTVAEAAARERTV